MKKVLFVCVENACRSQMAEAIYNKYAKESVAYSAGTNPAKKIDPLAIKVLKEDGFDLKNKKPTNYLPIINEEFDVIVTMGCKEVCPITPSQKTLHWNIQDPRGKNINAFREVKEIIESKIKELLKTADK